MTGMSLVPVMVMVTGCEAVPSCDQLVLLAFLANSDWVSKPYLFDGGGQFPDRRLVDGATPIANYDVVD